MEHKLTTRDVLSIYGINSRTLDVWVAEGCPVAVKGAGRRQSRYDARKFAKWVTAHGKNPKGIEGAAIKESMKDTREQHPDPPIAPQAPDRPDAGVISSLGLLGCLERVRQQERALHGTLINAIRAGATPGEIGAINRIITAKAAELRQLELAALEYQRKTGELVNAADVQRRFVELASGTRERVMAIPNTITPSLRPFLKDADQAGKVKDLIDDAIRHALTALPKTLPQGGK
jgi:phage terminase Nu1 subunit (DNA packaging protein)